MVSDRQREFNKNLHSYLKKLPKDRHKSSRKGFLRERKAKEKIDILEEKELENADREVAKQGFFSRLRDWVFGSQANVISEEDFEEGAEKLEEEPGESKKSMEKSRESHIDSIKRVLGLDKESEEFVDEKEPEIKKVVLVRPEVEKDMRFVMNLMDSVSAKINIHDRAKFLQSKEYKIYQEVKKRYR